MKKIMFLFLMFIGLLSTASALDTIKIGADCYKTQTVDWGEYDAIAIPSDRMDIAYLLNEWPPTPYKTLPGFSSRYKDKKVIALLNEWPPTLSTSGYS